MNERYLRKSEVAVILGVSETTIWRLEKAGDFPRRRRIAHNSVGYLSSEILEWIRNREPVGEGVHP